MEGNLPSPNFDAKPSADGFIQFSSTPVHGSNFKPKYGKKNRADNWKRFGQSENLNNSSSGNSSFTGDQISGGGQQQQSDNYNHQGYNSPRGRGGGGGPYSWRGGGGNITPRGGRGFNNSWRGSPRGNYGPSTPRGGGGAWATPRGRGNSYGSNGNRNSYSSNGSSNNWSDRSHSGSNGSGSGFYHPSMIEDPWAQLEAQRSRRLNSERSNESKTSISDSMIPQFGDSLLQRNQALDETLEAEQES